MKWDWIPEIIGGRKAEDKEFITITPQVLDLKPDDILVLSYDYYLTEAQVKNIRKQWGISPYNKHKAILLEGGGKLSVLKGL